MTSFLFYAFFAFLSTFYLIFFMFGFLGRGLAHDILAVFVLTLTVVIPTLVWKNSTKVQKFKNIKN